MQKCKTVRPSLVADSFLQRAYTPNSNTNIYINHEKLSAQALWRTVFYKGLPDSFSQSAYTPNNDRIAGTDADNALTDNARKMCQ